MADLEFDRDETVRYVTLAHFTRGIKGVVPFSIERVSGSDHNHILPRSLPSPPSFGEPSLIDPVRCRSELVLSFRCGPLGPLH